MQIFESKKTIKNYLFACKKAGKTIGFVPTMGALHAGHLSLVTAANSYCDVVAVSIFVNPTQFDNCEDLEKYPQPLKNDIALLKNTVCDVLFCPSAKEMYDEKLVSENFEFDGLDQVMEGEFRKGHFNGVGTVVKRLFEIVQPTIAFFGEKDFQQLQIIKKMVDNEQLKITIKGCPILREADGLAMSSRNERLTEAHRKEAPIIYKTLKKAKLLFIDKPADFVLDWIKGEFKNNPLLNLEYISIANEKTLLPITEKQKDETYRAFIAVFAGDIRLIDNIKL